MEALDLANSSLAAKVPELVAFLILAIGFVTVGWKMLGKGVSAANVLVDKMIGITEKQQDATAQMVKETRDFHSDLTASTNKVVVDNTVQMARTQDCLNRVLTKLGNQ